MGLREKLLALGTVLDRTADGGDLLNFNARELVGRLEALVASKESLVAVRSGSHDQRG